MNKELHDHLVDRIHRRALQLARITDRSKIVYAPDPVIALISRNLILTLCALLGEGLLRTLLEWTFGEVSEKYGVCRYCRERPFVEKLGMCERCSKELEDKDKEVTAQMLMDGIAKRAD